MKHVIDAKDKKLGRIASEAAIILMGKNRTDFAKNTVPEVTVEVTNASKIFIDPKKSALLRLDIILDILEDFEQKQPSNI